MVLSMAGKSNTSVSKGTVVIGSSVAAIQAALTLAQMGVEVKVITNSASLGWNGATSIVSGNSSPGQRYLWPLLLRAASHPLITIFSNAQVERIEGQKDDFKIKMVQRPRYIHEDLCTSCGRCQAECSASVISLIGDQKITHSAIHNPILGDKAAPSAYVIDKNGAAPCHVACPLGINVQGFVSLLANGKTDRALALINEAAPFSGILGRVCRHPCEANCNRAKFDSPVFIRALHRYAADNAYRGTIYQRKLPAKSRQEKIAIVGSGPAGLTAAWELTRLGYSPTVFEAHGVIGGMLATGIPRFRLPREVREREIEVIKNLGVDIRTGITLGRDVTFAYLKERGYRAFFLALGAQQNNKLNIPGEELEGVVDCISLLLTLNLKVDTFVGNNVVIIGDGNTAIDSARTAIRRNNGTVKVLSWTVPEEITAGEEEVKEATQEGVSIEYCTIPVEILGDEGEVTGIRYQRTRLSEEIMDNGRHRPEPIPGTDFVIDADHVVVAIGQSPNTSQLNMEGLAIDSNSGVIRVNPLTLATNIPGVFAGGDCITGPNNVVEAMAAGLRAAESIDRYIQGRDIEKGRSLEPPQIAEINMDTVEAAPYRRATMPAIRSQKRANTFEETTTGLSAEVAQREAQRCLNCALCSQCMECTSVCELGAVFHNDDIRHLEVGAQTILSFPSSDSDGNTLLSSINQETAVEGIHVALPDSDGEPTNQLNKAMVMALETAAEIKPVKATENQAHDLTEPDTDLVCSHLTPEHSSGSKRLGVFLCHCGGSISSIIDFRTLDRRISDLPGVNVIQEIAQACTEEGAKQIASRVAEWQLDGLVLAACRCCNLEQVCYSCTDRRQMCQQYLNQDLILPHQTTVEFVNIREQCAWVHEDDPKGATRKAVQIISSGVTHAKLAPITAPEEKAILPSALIIGGGPASLAAARALASRGYQTTVVARERITQGKYQPDETIPPVFEQLQDKNLIIKSWPNTLKLNGSPGNYEAVMEYGSQVCPVTAGAVLADTEELNKGVSPLVNTNSISGLLSRLISRRTGDSASMSGSSGDLLREVTIKETAGLFLLPPDGANSPDKQVLRGLAAAARISTFLEQASISPRTTAVHIDSKMCRGCGDCADICPYIEMREREDGTLYACIDKILCLGCGACITSCPAGAITQPLQSDKQIISTLRSMLKPGQILSKV
ncbi:FAD-dependent oxidoreductase [Chloroflexota bacterium]